MKKLFYFLLFFVALLSVLINLYADKIIFRPVKDYWQLSLPFEETDHGLYMPPAYYMDTILLFPGHAGNAAYYQDFAQIYKKLGYGIFILDYPGFGKNENELTQENIYQSGLDAVNFLIKEKKTAPGNIILWGYSFGGAPAVSTAATMPDAGFKALILQSPFTNIPQQAAALAGGKYAPGSPLQKTIIGALHVILFNKSYDNLAKIAGVKAPVLIACSKQDMVIPPQMCEALKEAAPEGTKIFISSRGKHAGFDWLEKEALAFLGRKSIDKL